MDTSCSNQLKTPSSQPQDPLKNPEHRPSPSGIDRPSALECVVAPTLGASMTGGTSLEGDIRCLADRRGGIRVPWHAAEVVV